MNPRTGFVTLLLTAVEHSQFWFLEFVSDLGGGNDICGEGELILIVLTIIQKPLVNLLQIVKWLTVKFSIKDFFIFCVG